MSDPRPPENVPARPPVPEQQAEAVPVESAVPGRAGEASAPVYPSPTTPPPNPYGQAPARHAPPPASAQPFAPPSSPGFGAQHSGQYGTYGQPVAQPHYGQSPAQPSYGNPVYGQPAQGQAPYPQQGYPAPAGYAQSYGSPAPVAPPKPAARLATIALVLGIIGVVGGIFFGWTILLSIAAIALGFLARSREPHASGTALSAIVTGFVGAFLSVGWLVYSVVTWLALTAS